MKKNNFRGHLWSLLAVSGSCVALLFVGCDGARWNLQLRVNTEQTIHLDVIGLNHFDLKDWKNILVDDYWTNTSSMRQNPGRLTFEVAGRNIKLIESESNVPGRPSDFQGADSGTMTLLSTHPIWEEWRKRSVLAVGIIGDYKVVGAGSGDRRKIIVPLVKDYWDTRDSSLRVAILQNLLQVETPPSPKAAKIDAKYGL